MRVFASAILLILSAGLATAGMALFGEESGQIGLRYQSRSGVIESTSDRKALAILLDDLSRWQPNTSDIAVSRLYIARRMHDLSKDAEQRKEAEDRVRDGALALTSAAPLDARGWCALSLAEAKAGNWPGQVLNQLEACYNFSPREVGVVEPRLLFSLSIWQQLPQSLRIAAIADVTRLFGHQHFKGFIAERLAFGVVFFAPAQESLAATLIRGRDEVILTKYREAFAHYTKLRDAGESPPS